jgi:hypothetical protein
MDFGVPTPELRTTPNPLRAKKCWFCLSADFCTLTSAKKKNKVQATASALPKFKYRNLHSDLGNNAPRNQDIGKQNLQLQISAP